MGAWKIAAYVAALVTVILAADLLLFRDHVWARLLANVGIVLLFTAVYLRFSAQP